MEEIMKKIGREYKKPEPDIQDKNKLSKEHKAILDKKSKHLQQLEQKLKSQKNSIKLSLQILLEYHPQVVKDRPFIESLLDS